MNLKTFARFGRRGRRLVWGGAITGLMLAAGTTAIGDVSPEAKRLADQNRASLSLFAGPTAVLQGNQLQCGIVNFGDVCANVFNSPTGGGGFWPTGSQNQYIFNTGLQIAGVMGDDGGPWANDTVGAYFFDARGTQAHGTPLTNIFDSLNPDDFANWPAEAFIPEGSPLFQPVLQGRATASQQDSWVQYWDGDPGLNASRAHPMGITVTQRSLAWNYPAGNESLIYFIYNFRNSTAEAEFQQLNEAQFFAGANELPDGGITINEIYAAFATDMDVGSTATDNLSTAVLPFDLGISYQGGFNIPAFTYPADLFFPPFFTNAPGLIGVKYLRSPIDPETGNQVGLTLFSITLNPGSAGPGDVADPLGDRQLWRYLSGKLNPAAGDPPCNVTAAVTSPDPDLVERSLCFIRQTAGDTRFFQASGPTTLGPGDDGTIVVAYIAAPTVASLPDGSPSGIVANTTNNNANPPGVPSFHPGFASARGCSDPGNVPASCTEVDAANPVKALERGAGWVDYNGPDPASQLETAAHKLDQSMVEVVPGSLLGRSLVAQEIFDSNFLLAFSPEQPTFYLVPGNNQVTVVWEPSPTEELGDPFVEVASDTESALFNPNFREFDVEGYRIWRGTSAGSLTLIEQFDYANTTFIDTTCETVQPEEDIDNPEGLGYAGAEECPDGFSLTRDIDASLIFNNASGGGEPGAGVARLADGRAAYTADPIVAIESDDAGASLPLDNSGVPFVYVDEDVTNNFTYFYAVSAFDLNSPASGPHTLRSARVTQSTVPRADAPNITNASLTSGIVGGDGEPLDTSAPLPDLDSEDGTFSGPFPPTNAIELSFAPLVPRLLPTLDLQVRIDSIHPDETLRGTCPQGTNALGSCWRIYASAFDAGVKVDESVFAGYTPAWAAFGEPAPVEFQIASAEVPFDQDALAAFGIPSGSSFAAASATFDEEISYSTMEGQLNRRSLNGNFDFLSIHGGSRWFSGANESVADPTTFIEVGQLDGVSKVWAPIHNTPVGPGMGNLVGGGAPCFSYGLSFLGRAADVRFTWNGGTFGEVLDVTHNAEVEYKPTVQASWGFLNEDANGNGSIDWDDFNYISNVSSLMENIGFCNHAYDAGALVDLDNAPVIQNVSTATDVDPSATNPLPPTAQGFGLYVNGERYIFEMDALPSDGTEWMLRTYIGAISTPDETLDSTDPSGYEFTTDVWNSEGFRSVMIPGLQMQFTVESATNFDDPADLTQVHTVPDPYLGSSLYDRAPTEKQLMFVNLPPEATIRIYTLTGVLVDVLIHDDITGGGRLAWNVRNRNNQFVASGVYFYHVMTPSGDSHVGKFTIVNQAGSN